MKCLLLLFLSGMSLSSCSQEKNIGQVDLITMNKADSVISKSFSKKVENKAYCIFSIVDQYYLITIDNGDHYSEHYYSYGDDSPLHDTVYSKPHKTLDKMFDKTIYRKGFTTFDSDFFKEGYDMAKGNKTYFVLVDKNGDKHGE
jgi:hypothetical protein